MDMKITLTALLISTVALSGCSNSRYSKSNHSESKKPRATVASILKGQGSDVEINALGTLLQAQHSSLDKHRCLE